MFDIGFFELLLVLLVGLLVLGPERLPHALRGLQRALHSVKRYSSHVQAEVNHELRIRELHEHLAKAEQLPMDQLPVELQRSIAELKAAAAQVQRPYAKTTDKPGEEPPPS